MVKPAENKISESDLRDAVASWLVDPSGGGCVFVPAIPSALRDPRPDAVGLRHTGGQLAGDFEVIAVEVRSSTKKFISVSGHVSSHSIHADRIYLACYLPESEFTEDQLDVAQHLGIGLIRIDHKLLCHRSVLAPANQTIAATRTELLYQLGLVACQMCGVAYSLSATDSDAVFWNEIWADRIGRLRNESVYDRRYLCPDCVRNVRDLSSKKQQDNKDSRSER
tara:strand:+ start:2091 stop:2759 length:669 start_codon:yes stop_codon:yes gene_type:complete